MKSFHFRRPSKLHKVSTIGEQSSASLTGRQLFLADYLPSPGSGSLPKRFFAASTSNIDSRTELKTHDKFKM